MVFSGIPFIYFFLPPALLLGCFAPRKLRSAVLLLLSLVFYFFGEPRCIPLLVFTALSAWLCGLWAEKQRDRAHARLPLISICVLSLSQLVYFKYADFLISTINGVLGAKLPLLHVVLPIGISFYTFQAISYVADVTRGEVEAAHSPIDFLAYLSFFPQLIAGPIVRYGDVREALTHGRTTRSGFASGASRFCAGLGKKVLLANVLSEATNDFAGAKEESVLFLWLYALCNALSIYFDFSGYSDMAVGLGRMFGFEFPENFKYPFLSKSVAEFWRRWHITLGTWFRDYVYIPLGGSRCGALRQVLNLLAVWAFTGLWHGASWTFVLWGLYFAAFLILERFVLGKILKKLPAVLTHAYVILAVLISFVLFSAPTAGEAARQTAAMFGLSGAPLWNAESLFALRQYGVVLLVSLIGAAPVVPFVKGKLSALPHGEAVCAVLQPILMLVLLVLSTAYLAAGSFNPFLYFRF